jgi:N-carbamoylputrescine amidase
MNVAIVQNKPRKGDIARNLADVEAHFHTIAAGDAPDLIVLPEAALTGYFLEGAVFDMALTAEDAAAKIASAWRRAAAGEQTDIVLGFFEIDGGTYYNSSIYVSAGGDGYEILHVHRKVFLPTYGVFDEERFLSRGGSIEAFDTAHGRMAILICEDAWHSIMPTLAAVAGARYLIVPSAPPGRGLASGSGELESVEDWEAMLRLYAREHGLFIIYAGLAGFEGGKGMTGSSCVVDPRGTVLVSAPSLGGAIVRAELDPREADLARASLPLLGDLRAVLPDLLGALEL